MIVPASGLSVTQRRILTLLDSPARLGDLQLGRSLDAGRLAHDAVRLRHAGLIVCETTRDTGGVAAANAATMHAPKRPLARPLPIAVALIAASVVVWTGWRYNASVAPPSDSRRHARTAPTAIVPMTPAPETSNDPPVIATRVLKGDIVDRSQALKDRTPARTPAPPPSVQPSTETDSRAKDARTTPESPPDP